MHRFRTTLTSAIATALCVFAGPSAAQHYGAWGNPQPVAAIDTASAEGCPIESRDGLDLYFASNRVADGAQGALDIYRVHRASASADWGEAKNLGATVNSPEFDYCPTPLPGKWLLFVSSTQTGDDCYPGDVPPTGSPPPGDIFLSRENPAHGWLQPMHLGCYPDGPNTPGAEFSPSLVETAEGTFLFFSSNGYPESVGRGHDVYMSRVLDDGTVLPGVRVAELSSDKDDLMPNVRKDGLEIVFSSNRASATPFDQDIYVATRSDTASPWTNITRITNTEINTQGSETRASLSGDGTRLYFGRKTSSTDPGDVFMSTRWKLAGTSSR